MRYYLIAGEASGDLHGSNLLKGLYNEDPSCTARFWGGPLMDGVRIANEGTSGLVHDYNEGAMIGFSEVISKAPKLLRNLRSCKEDITSWKPDVIILIDYPGFNFRIASWAHKKGFRVVYYIAPKVWASRESRVRKLRKYVDRLYIVFPFEKEYFKRKRVPFTYVGNPLIDAIDGSPALAESREDFFGRILPRDKGNTAAKKNGFPYIALLAGSRRGEVSYMMPRLAQFTDLMHSLPKYRDYHFIIAGAPSRTMEDYKPYLEGREDYLHVVFGETYGVLRHAEAAVINSGTASLEAALIGTPQVVCYGGTEFTYLIGRQILKAPFISLGNLIINKLAFKELLQYYFTPEAVLSEIRRILEDRAYRSAMLSDYEGIRKALGGPGASSRVAAAVVSDMKKN